MSPTLVSPTNSPVPVTSQLFANNVALEVVRRNNYLDELELVHWRGRVIRVGPSVQHGGQRYVPIDLPQTIAHAVRFPARVGSSEKVCDLFKATELLFACYLGLTGASLIFTVAWQLASWLYGVLAHAPVLWMTASPQSPTHVAMQLLSLVGRHAIRISGVSRRELCSVRSLQGTMLADAPDFGDTAEYLLLNGTRPGTHVVHRGIVDLFSPKVVLTRKLPSGIWRDSEILRISLTPSRTRIETPDPQKSGAIAEEFQARFLGFRLRHLADIRRPDLKSSRLSPPMQDLAATLGAAMMGDRHLVERIIEALESRE